MKIGIGFLEDAINQLRKLKFPILKIIRDTIEVVCICGNTD